jgi:hypothetical protein
MALLNTEVNIMIEKSKEKLTTLLSYLIDHNRDHSEELKGLAEKVIGVTGDIVQSHILEAARLLDESTGSLAKALSELSKD